MSEVLTFFGLVVILLVTLTVFRYFEDIEQFFFSKWRLNESFEYVGVFLSLLKVYPYFIILFLSVEYRNVAKTIIWYYYNASTLWAELQFMPVITMVALTCNMLFVVLPEYRVLGKRRHSLISRTFRVTIVLIAIHLFFFTHALLDTTEVGISGIYSLGALILLGVCTLLSSQIVYKPRLYFILLHLITIALIGAFSTFNLFFFYIFFELTLIPTFLIIIIWGSRHEKSAAAYNLFLYTLLGSLFFLMSLIFINYWTGTANILELQSIQFSLPIEKFLFLIFWLGFAIKIPMFPTHIWLPKAHVEAPTVGSILLAGILLKLGSYVYLRFVPTLFPSAFLIYRPFITVLALLGIIYASFAILRQIDLKRIVAYSSISHMNLVVLGCLAGNLHTTVGSILLTVAHGLASGGLFACVGAIYDRFKTRNLLYLRALNNFMPILSAYFFLFTLANIGFPPSLNFISEILILVAIPFENILLPFFLVIGISLSAIAGFWTYCRIFLGNYDHTHYGNAILKYSDLTLLEILAMLPLVVLAFGLGLYPQGLIALVA